MSKCAFFVSAPTVRFLQAIRQLDLLPSAERRKIAATVYTEIKPLVGSRDIDELRRAAQVAQDERWRLIFRGICEITDARFASVVIAEQWLLARFELVHAGSPVAEVLGEKRRGAIEKFITDNLSFERGEIVHLHARGSLQRTDRGEASKSAA